MNKSIIYTVNGKMDSELPKISNKHTTDKGIYILLSAILLKEIKGKNPGPVMTQKFWEEIILNDSLYFDRTLIRGEIKDYFQQSLKNNIELDIIYLKKICEKIKSNNDWNKIKEEVIKNESLLKIISNITENSKYCYIMQEIKMNVDNYLSSKTNNLYKKILTPDEYLRLEELLDIDFKLINDFVEKMKISFTPKHNHIYNFNSLIQDIDITIQQNTDVEDLLDNDFITVNLINKEHDIEIDKDIAIKDLKYFLYKDNKQNINRPTIIIGDSGSGKSVLGFKLCCNAIKENYLVKFINLEKYTSNSEIQNLKSEIENMNQHKIFIYFDNLNCLSFNKTKSSFIELISSLMENKNNFILISSTENSSNNNSFLNSAFLLKFSERLNIRPLKLSEKRWIKTPLEYVIYHQIKSNVKTRGALYYSYINKLLEDDFNYDDYSLTEFKNDFHKIAYYSMIKNLKIDELKKYGINNKVESIIKKNKIVQVDNNNFGCLTFANSIFRDFLAAGYIINSSKENLEKMIQTENFNTYKWRSTMLFISEWLHESITDIYKPLLTTVLFHLRQQKDFNKVDEILSLISDIEYKNNQNHYLFFEKATSFYYRGNYLESIKNSVKSLSEINDYSSNSNVSKIYNLIASCTNDLFLPYISLKLNNIGIIYADNIQKPRLLGNQGRSYIKMADFNSAYNCFSLKKKLNKNINDNEDLRDEVDLLLLESINYENNYLDENKPIDLYNKSKEIIKMYEYKERDLDIDDSDNKIYVYRNISFLLPKVIGTSIEKELFNFVKSSEEISVKESGSFAVCLFNLAKYFYKSKNIDVAYSYFNQALEIFKADNYKRETYQTLLYIYMITNLDEYYNQAIDIYEEIKKDAENVISEINNQSLILHSFGIEFSIDNFVLPKIKKDHDLESKLENLFIF